MTEPTSIFRREALDFRSGVLREPTALQLGGRWSELLYGLVLILGVAAVAVGVAVRTEATTSGPALLDTRTGSFVALLPVAAGPEIKGGQLARLRPAHATGRTLVGQVRHAELTDGNGVRQAGFASAAGPAVLVSGVLAGDAKAGVLPQQQGRAVIVLRSGRFVDLFFDGVGDLFAKGGEA